MKRIFTFFAVIAIACGMFAQLQKSPNFIPFGERMNAPKADDLEIGYCDFGGAITNGIGTGAIVPLAGAILIDQATFGMYAGSSIKTINIGFAQAVTTVSVWFRSSLTGADLYTQTVENKAAGWHAVELTTPFEIPEGDFYMGVSCTPAASGNAAYCMAFNGTANPNGAFLMAGGQWNSYHTNGWGSFCITGIIDGTTIAAMNDIGISGFSKIYAQVEEPIAVTGTVRNNMDATLTSFKINYTIDEGTPVERTITCNVAGGGTDAAFSFDIDAIVNPGELDVTVTVTDINNGTADEFADNNTATFNLAVMKYLFPKRVVAEEGTGTWCGWCPRGMVGMAGMKEKYPDTFIGIAVHNEDPMMVAAYDDALGFKSFPNSIVNRKTESDPGFNSLEAAYLAEQQIPSQIGIELEAMVNIETGKVYATSTVTFGYNSTTANYRIAYVVVENDVTGNGNGWSQSNYYVGGDAGEMGGWENLPSLVSGVHYNDVARGIYSAFGGVPSSIPATVEENVPFNHAYTITLPNTIQDMDQLEIVALLIDVASGNIVNGAKVEPVVTADTKFILTYQQPTNGTLTVTAGGATVESGSMVNENTELTITATPAEGYEIGTLTVNGAAFTSGETHTVVGDVNIVCTMTAGVDKNTLSGIAVYGKGSTVNIVNNNNIRLQSIEIIDMAGRTVYASKSVTSNAININAASGHYVVKLISEDGKVSTSKIYLSK